MKFLFNPKDNSMEIEVKTLPTFCMACGGWMGDIMYIRDDSMWIHLIHPLCRKCFEEKIGKMVEPKVSRSMLPQNDLIDHSL